MTNRHYEWVEDMLVPVGTKLGKLIEPDDEVDIDSIASDVTQMPTHTYPRRSESPAPNTDYLFWEGVSEPYATDELRKV